MIDMGWDKDGRYYTRSRREGGRVIREYVGRGPLAELEAAYDRSQRERRAAERYAWRQEQERVRRLDHPVAQLDALCSQLMASTLEAAGYHQNDRGAWRRRRG